MFNNKIDTINTNIEDWWCKYSDTFKYKVNKSSQPKVLPPSWIHNLSKDAEILFVGFNPSAGSNFIFQLDQNKKCVSAKNLKDKIIEEGIKSFKENKYPQYFKVIHEIGKELLGKDEYLNKIEHIDLFHCRGTDSKQVKGWLNIHINNFKIAKDNSYADKHKHHGINILLDVVNYLDNLKVIIFNNANSSNLIRNNMNFIYDSKLHIHKLENSSNKKLISNNKLYFYFQGSMGYGRLDLFAKERLINIIKNVI